MPWPVKRLTQRTAVVHVIASAATLQFMTVVAAKSTSRHALHEGHDEGICGEGAQFVPGNGYSLAHN